MPHKVVDCNGRAVSVFDGRGVLLAELSGKHLPRKVETESAAGAEVGWQDGGFKLILKNRSSIDLHCSPGPVRNGSSGLK